MDEQVKERVEALASALVDGDMERATQDFSQELRQKLGEVLVLLPLPSTEATVESVDHGGSGYTAVLRLVGETDEVLLQTRWKERDGRPTLVEASHLSKTARTAPDAGAPGDEDETRTDEPA